MPLIFDHAQQPPNGYTFSDLSGVDLKADTLRALIKAIAAFRFVNGLPPGNPEAEVEADYKMRHPWLVTKVGVTPTTTEDPVLRWLNRLWRHPPKEKDFCESEIVRVKLETCAKCPHLRPDHPYDVDAARRMMILSVGRAKDFSACDAHHWVVGVAALIHRPEVTVHVDGCWAGDPLG